MARTSCTPSASVVTIFIIIAIIINFCELFKSSKDGPEHVNHEIGSDTKKYDNDQLAKKSPHSVQETAAKKRARAVTFSHHARSAFSAEKMEIKTKTLDSKFQSETHPNLEIQYKYLSRHKISPIQNMAKHENVLVQLKGHCYRVAHKQLRSVSQ